MDFLVPVHHQQVKLIFHENFFLTPFSAFETFPPLFESLAGRNLYFAASAVGQISFS